MRGLAFCERLEHKSCIAEMLKLGSGIVKLL